MAEKTIPAKAREQAAAKGQTAYGTSFPIRDKDELRRAVAAYGRAPEGKRALLRRFILSRARALGAMDLVPDSWKAGEMSVPQARAAVVELTRRGFTVELERVIDMASNAGLVPVKVKVTNRQGTTFERTMMVRPGQRDQMRSEQGGRKLSAQGRKVTREQTAVLQELAKIPKDQRPAGWDTAVRALADPRHGGRLGPEKRRALRDLQANAPDGPLKDAVTAALKADAKPAKPEGQKKAVKARKAERKTAGSKPQSKSSFGQAR